MDKEYMERALELAKRGRFNTTPNPNVGCVIVRNMKIIGEGWHFQAGGPHAEIHALQIAKEKARGSTAYITLEPCIHYGKTPPCCDALINSGVIRVVIAMKDPNPKVTGKGIHRLQQAGIEVNYGLMQKEAKFLNRAFLKRMQTNSPYVRLKLSASLDGRTAMKNGESKWITSLTARRDVQILRAESSAILSTSATVISDNPLLNVRWVELNDETKKLLINNQKFLRQPIRIIIDSKNRVTPQHRLIREPGEVWLIRQKKDTKTWPNNIKQITVPSVNQKIDLIKMMLILGRNKINSLLVEAGSSLSGALIHERLVDELIIYLAPKLLGDQGKGFCNLPFLKKLIDAPTFSFRDIRLIGEDLRLTLT